MIPRSAEVKDKPWTLHPKLDAPIPKPRPSFLKLPQTQTFIPKNCKSETNTLHDPNLRKHLQLEMTGVMNVVGFNRELQMQRAQDPAQRGRVPIPHP